MTDIHFYDTIVIGGGQSGLACGYFLQRSGLNYLILDDQLAGGGAWIHGWDSLSLFSPAEYSSLPGWMMPKSENLFPLKQEVIEYLRSYEQRYKLKIERPVKVNNVGTTNTGFIVESDKGIYYTHTVVSASGTWNHPIIPDIANIKAFSGQQLHSADYKNPGPFIGKKILVVGGGNSGAQVLAELSLVTETKWATLHEPAFLPDDVDGRVLFNTATAKYNALQGGKEVDTKQYSLGNIVMVDSVKKARDRSVLKSSGKFKRLSAAGVIWESGIEELFDVIIWCTGFGFATQYLSSLIALDEKGKAVTMDTRAINLPGLWLVGYGNWTGFASATLIGVGRSTRQTIKEIEEYLIKMNYNTNKKAI